MHGLPAEKKRELEHLLHTFTRNLNKNPTTLPSSSATYGSAVHQQHSGHSYQGQRVPNLKTQHTDSGYVSNSASGQTSTHVSAGGRDAPLVSKSSRNQSIQNYLHDIPDTLLPRQSIHMSERAKLALVVRRLEQLFTGKQAAPGEHSQPEQQQEVSRSAARADAVDPFLRIEGSREAHMLPQDSKLNLDALQQDPSPPQKGQPAKLQQASGSTSGTGSPGQRPTRPLDLDIHRAQVAAENVEYLRHLGLSSDTAKRAETTGEPSFIYLNLLISMAQLHTINVTPAFIRRAIRKMSTKLELSADGNKVRWKGGSEVTTFSTEEERAMDVTSSNTVEVTEENTGGSSSKRSKATSSSNNLTSEKPSSADRSGQLTSAASKQQSSTLPTSIPVTKTGSSFDYQPLFFKGRQYSPQASYLEKTESSNSSKDSSGLVRALSNSRLTLQNSDEGMITFFSNPFFCSDASADSAPIEKKSTRALQPWRTLGVVPDTSTESPLRHSDACYFTPQFAVAPLKPSPSQPTISFSVTELTIAGEPETQPIELPASGLGGIYPEDNFALDVKVGRQLQSPKPTKVRRPLTKTLKRERYSYRTLRTELLTLQPSRLPPPSYIFFTSSSSSDHNDDSGSDSSSSANEDFAPPPGFLHHWSSGTSDADVSKAGDESEDVDMLAMARQVDPDRIAKQERVFVMNRPGGEHGGVSGWVEGSLAATTGASRDSEADAENVDVSRREEDYDDEVSVESDEDERGSLESDEE